MNIRGLLIFLLAEINKPRSEATSLMQHHSFGLQHIEHWNQKFKGVDINSLTDEEVIDNIILLNMQAFRQR